jgi:hypothetical protein
MKSSLGTPARSMEIAVSWPDDLYCRFALKEENLLLNYVQELAVIELSLSPHDKYRRLALCTATDKLDETGKVWQFFN